MINSVNGLNGIVNVQGANKVSNPQQAPVNVPVENTNVSMNGTEALAAYNVPNVNKQEAKVIQHLLPTVLQPQAIHSMKGERITSATGTLTAIVDRGEQYTTVYNMDVLAPQDAISKIETFDNKTGKLVRLQRNFNEIKQGQMPVMGGIDVYELDPESGKIVKFTNYYKGKIDQSGEYEYGPGNYMKMSAVCSDGTSYIEENFDNNKTKLTEFDKSGKVERVVNSDRENYSEEVIFYQNGIPARIEKRSETPIPNTTGKNPFADKDLIPGKPYVLGYDPKNVQGEKTYYSNGSLEAIMTKTQNGYVVHKFELNGVLTGIEDAQNPNNVKTILYNDMHNGYKSYSVEEKIADNIQKTTTFISDDTVEVRVANLSDNTEKLAFYNKQGKLKCYVEASSGGKRTIYTYNNNGELVNLNYLH